MNPAIRSIIFSLIAMMLTASGRAEEVTEFFDDSRGICSSLRNYFSQLFSESPVLVRPYLEFSAGSQPGVNQSYSTLGVMAYLPIYKFSNYSRIGSYTDVCWFHFLKGTNAASIEEGLIWQTNYCCFGAYLGYDWRRWDNHSFNQVSYGLTMTCCNWNLRLNMNYPLEKEHIICYTVCDYEAGYRSIFTKYDATYRTLSLTIARSFCTNLSCLDFSAAIEPYYISTNSRDQCGHNEKSWGGKIRFLFDLSDMFHAELSISQDKIFNTHSQITIGIDLLKAFSNCSCAYPCSSVFQRQKIVPIKRKEWCWQNW